ncbi:hypothetical protein L9F63_013857, partial [Diploptera punctata]
YKYSTTRNISPSSVASASRWCSLTVDSTVNVVIHNRVYSKGTPVEGETRALESILRGRE